MVISPSYELYKTLEVLPDMLIDHLVVEKNLSRLHEGPELSWASVCRSNLTLDELLLWNLTKHLCDIVTRLAEPHSIIDARGEESRSGATILSNLLIVLRSV